MPCVVDRLPGGLSSLQFAPSRTVPLERGELNGMGVIILLNWAYKGVRIGNAYHLNDISLGQRVLSETLTMVHGSSLGGL